MHNRHPTYLGTIQDVNGATVSVALSENTVSGFTIVDGYGYRVGQIGTFVIIPIGFLDLFGVVCQVGAGAVPERLATAQPHGMRWMTIQLIGEALRSGEFQRGISTYPTIGDPVHLVAERDLARLYGHHASPSYVRIGHVAGADSIPALIDINKLIVRHSAIVGTTGSGKSTTVASILNAIADTNKYQSARVLLIDLHGEYANAFRDRATVFKINPDIERGERELQIPYWALNGDELLNLTMGDLDDNSRSRVIEKVTELKSESLRTTARDGVTLESLSVDIPVPFSIHRFWFDLHRLMFATHSAPGTGQSQQTETLAKDSEGNIIQPGDPFRVITPLYEQQRQAQIYLSGSNLSIRRQLESLASKLRDPRYDFLFKPGPWTPSADTQQVDADLDLLFADWVGGPNPISILDLSGVPTSILTNLVGALLRIIYDSLFWARNLSEGARERPILIVLEEAHAYLSNDAKGDASAAVKRIVKEGRKYGIGCMIVSQRPSEIESTILSQCGTLIALRLSNDSDRSHVTGAVSDNLESLLRMLPVLKTGEALITGEAVNLPIRALIQAPSASKRPDSKDPLVVDDGPGGWNRKREVANYSEVIAVWRAQNPLFTKRSFQPKKMEKPSGVDNS